MTLNLFTPSSKNFKTWPQMTPLNDLKWPKMTQTGPKWLEMTSNDLDVFKCYQDLSEIHLDRKSKIPGIQPTYELFGLFKKFYSRRF